MTRAEAIEILKKLIEAMQGHVTVLPTPERIATIRLAIASLETDEAYQLEYEKPTTKNDLGVDCISRQAVLDLIADYDLSMGQVVKGIHALPSITPQEPKTGHCKDCKYFELDSWANYDGIPIIVAHEICKAWGEGCKTKSDGYCFQFEPQESEDT